MAFDRGFDDSAHVTGEILLDFVPRMAHVIRYCLSRLDPALTYRQFHVLHAVDKGAHSLTALRKYAIVSLSALSETVDSLVVRGLMTRTHRNDDRRGIQLDLSAEGKQALKGARVALDELTSEVLADVAATNLLYLRRSLETIYTNASRLLANASGLRDLGGS